MINNTSLTIRLNEGQILQLLAQTLEILGLKSVQKPDKPIRIAHSNIPEDQQRLFQAPPSKTQPNALKCENAQL